MITVKFLQGYKGSVTCRAAATVEELVTALCTTAGLERTAIANFIVRGRCPRWCCGLAFPDAHSSRGSLPS